MVRWFVKAVGVAFVVWAGSVYVAKKVIPRPDFQFFGDLVTRVETDEKVVAITLDDGPTAGDLDTVLATLDGVPSTFFVNLEHADCAGALRRLVENGHELANHTSTHRRMVGITPATVRNELLPVDEQIRATGQTGPIMFRPPYGRKFLVLPAWLARHGRLTVECDVAVETFDDAHPQSAEEIADLTVAQVRPGSIVLLHPWDGRTNVQTALPLIVQRLRDQGYRFATVRDLLKLAA